MPPNSFFGRGCNFEYFCSCCEIFVARCFTKSQNVKLQQHHHAKCTICYQRTFQVGPKGPRCTKTESSWTPYLTKVAARWSKNGPSLIIRRPSSCPKLTLIYHVETADRHAPPQDFGRPEGVKMSPDGRHGQTHPHYI